MGSGATLRLLGGDCAEGEAATRWPVGKLDRNRRAGDAEAFTTETRAWGEAPGEARWSVADHTCRA